MRNPANRRYTSEIECVAGVLSESPNAALAQDDVVVALRHDVFGCEQPFFECCSHSSLQQDWQLRSSSSFEKRKVLHVSSADLNHIAIFFYETDVIFFERFCDNL